LALRKHFTRPTSKLVVLISDKLESISICLGGCGFSCLAEFLLWKQNKTSNSLVTYLLSSVRSYRDHVAHLLTSSAEQRLARVLLRLAHLDKNGPPVVEIPILSHRVLAEMVGTTRSRVNFFMNRFRKHGFIDYDGGLEVRQSLRKVLRSS
jgi:CRP/FNR family cyclic AMP-dependent transcriptional regulator